MAKAANLRDDLAEWIRLKSFARQHGVLETIESRISSLERALETLGPVKQNDIAEGDSAPASSSEMIFAVISNFSWLQSESFVKIYFQVTGVDQVPSTAVSADFKSNSVEVKVVNIPGVPNQHLHIKRLNKKILPEKCTFKINKNNITVSLKKASQEQWDDIKYKEPAKVPKVDPVTDSGDPGASLMKLMKNLYQEGDDDLKRTIEKAWSESQSGKMPKM